jgi:hypothetical protein
MTKTRTQSKGPAGVYARHDLGGGYVAQRDAVKPREWAVYLNGAFVCYCATLRQARALKGE